MNDDRQKLRERQQREVDANYEAFQGLLPKLLGHHAGKFALMKGGEIIDYFDSDRDAWTAGQLLYKGDVFSVQEVDARPVDLGWMGYALFHRPH